jgi:hypothetical protein
MARFAVPRHEGRCGAVQRHHNTKPCAKPQETSKNHQNRIFCLTQPNTSPAAQYSGFNYQKSAVQASSNLPPKAHTASNPPRPQNDKKQRQVQHKLTHLFSINPQQNPFVLHPRIWV